MTSVLLVTSNGTGMGHLTRLAAVAKALAPEHTSTLFSLSLGLPMVLGLGLRGEYCPSYEAGHIDRMYWESYLRDRLVALAREVRAEVVIFDGVAPYLGLGRARQALPDTHFVWLRRGMWRQGTGAMLRRSVFFDLVIEPGDLGGDQDSGPTANRDDAFGVEPVSLLEVLDPLPRDEARHALGLPHDGVVGLITLGTGRLGDVAGPGTVAAETVTASSGVQLAVTKWVAADRAVPIPPGVTELSGVYPLAQYLNAFDFAVSSAGYNAVHELLPAGIPTLFVANTATRTDDQEARSVRLAELGLSLHARDDDPSGVREQVVRLLEPGLRSELAAASAETRKRLVGARQVGEIATADLAPPDPNAMGEIDRIGRMHDFREAVKRVLGERGTNVVRRLLGRTPRPVGTRTRVHIVDRPMPDPGGDSVPLAFTDELAPDDLLLGIPVEHFLPGTDPLYRRRRRELIDKYYRVR